MNQLVDIHLIKQTIVMKRRETEEEPIVVQTISITCGKQLQLMDGNFLFEEYQILTVHLVTISNIVGSISTIWSICSVYDII
jgi:hypothetical protein